MLSARRVLALLVAVSGVWGGGCHREVELPPLPELKISILGDRFFDVKALSPDRALVIGYRGKVLETTDAGRNWEIIPTPTDRALYNIRFGDPPQNQIGWICGESGLILHTTDGGKTWTQQESGIKEYLFALDALSPTHVYAVGDRSVLLETTDGGATWMKRKIAQSKAGISEDIALAVQDPVFYDVAFTDELHGWVVGEFGTIEHTTDGGETWEAQQASLLSETIVDILDLPTLFGVHFVNGQEGIAAGLEGAIARTHDGGEHWAFDTIDEEIQVLDPLYAPFLFPDGKGWVIGSGGEVVTTDAGQSAWKRADLGMRLYTWLRGIDFFDHNNGWIVGGFGTILKTKDGGKTWTPSFA
jgi:photosystem II stability/assembly factor-like uncharacterized protein